MKFVQQFVGRTKTATESATIALNATQDAYAYLEAERKNVLTRLLHQAIANLEGSGVDPQSAINLVVARGQYLKELSRGSKMFHQAAAQLKQQDTHRGAAGGESTRKTQPGN